MIKVITTLEQIAPTAAGIPVTSQWWAWCVPGNAEKAAELAAIDEDLKLEFAINWDYIKVIPGYKHLSVIIFKDIAKYEAYKAKLDAHPLSIEKAKFFTDMGTTITTEIIEI